MIYPFMTLSDNTEITFGKPIENDTGEHVDVFIETPVSTCLLYTSDAADD